MGESSTKELIILQHDNAVKVVKGDLPLTASGGVGEEMTHDMSLKKKVGVGWRKDSEGRVEEKAWAKPRRESRAGMCKELTVLIARK